MRFHATELNVPLKAPFRIATGEVRRAENVLCLVQQDGLAGVGEATPFEVITGGTQARVLADLRSISAGTELRDDDSIADFVQRVGVDRFGPDARNAIDVALHDWLARRRGVPLAVLLGGSPRPLPTSVTIPLVDLAEIPGRVRAALDEGFRILKVKSKAGVEEETRRVRLIRDLAGSSIELRVDANAGWSLSEARAMLPVLRAADVVFLEQPLRREDLQGHAELSRMRSVPIMLDETVFTLADAQKALDAKAADLINVKLAKSGGITEAGRILRFAEERGVDCMVGCMIQSRIATSQDAHVAAGFRAVKYVDLDGHTFLAEDPIVGGVRIEAGRIVFPDEEGHGARLAPGPLAASA